MEYPRNNPLAPDHKIMINPIIEIPIGLIKLLFRSIKESDK